jgi:hypothetical protein
VGYGVYARTKDFRDMKQRILSIDPSGTGTTGIYFKNGAQEQFKQYTGKEWVEHYRFILSLVRIWQPNFVLFENSNYVSLRGKDMTSLWKLLGAIEVLPYEFPVYLQTKGVPVNQVKGLRNKLLKKQQTITGLEYLPGKGWHHNGKKISTHELDAYLVYWLWESKANSKAKTKLVSKTIEANKNKQKVKTNDYEKETDDQELLERIEKLETETQRLEQIVGEIRNSCPCVSDFEEPGLECGNSLCFECGDYPCICELRELQKGEETEDLDKDIDHE